MKYTALLHFCVVEMRVAIVFYFSMQKMILDIAASLTTQSKTVTDFPAEYQSSIGKLSSCSTTGLNEAIESLNTTFVSSNGCVVFDQFANYFGYFNLSCAAVCLFFYLQGLFLFSRGNSMSEDFKSGSYLHFTYEIEDKTLYKLAARLVQVFVVIGFVCIAIMMGNHAFGDADWKDFIQQFWMTAVGLLWTALAFGSPPTILFYHDGETFQEMMFNRSVIEMFYGLNTDLAITIQQAMLMDLRSKDGSVKNLEAVFASDTPKDKIDKWVFSLLQTDATHQSALQQALLSDVDVSEPPPKPQTTPRDLQTSPRDAEEEGGGCTLC